MQGNFSIWAICRFAVALALLIVLSACSAGGGGNPNLNSDTFTQTDDTPATGASLKGAAARNAQDIFSTKSSGGSPESEDYKIAALDVVEVTVLGLPELNRVAQVSTSGTITLPLVKTVKAGGRTTAQLESDIAAKLRQNYLQNPQVSVFVKEYNSQKITVDGAVNKPGIFPTTGSVSLLQAIAMAEGLNAVADPGGIIIFRAIKNKRMAARFDLKSIRSGKLPDPQLKAGDIVMVDESATRTTLRDVKDALPLTGLFQLLLL